MLRFNLLRFFQICYGSCHSQNAVIRSCTQLQRMIKLLHAMLFFRSHMTIFFNHRRLDISVKPIICSGKSLFLTLSCPADPFSDIRAALISCLFFQAEEIHRLQFHTEINSVQNRPRHLPHIPSHLCLCAMAAVLVRIISTGTGVHRYNEIDTIQRCTPNAPP